MKTTVEIGDALFRQAKRLAVERNTSLRAVVETALQRYLDQAADGRRPAFRLRRHTFRGKGLQAGLDEHDWATVRKRAYGGRGG